MNFVYSKDKQQTSYLVAIGTDRQNREYMYIYEICREHNTNGTECFPVSIENYYKQRRWENGIQKIADKQSVSHLYY